MLSTLSRFERYIKISSYFGYKGDIFLEVYADFHYIPLERMHICKLCSMDVQAQEIILDPYTRITFRNSLGLLLLGVIVVVI